MTSNDKPNLERDQLDIAIRFVMTGGDVPDGELAFECKIHLACSPVLANDKLHPIKTPADLAHHVRLDYESMRDGRRLSLWDFWFDKTKIRYVKPASTLQFPQYDQLVSAAVDDAGVGIAVLPHTGQHLHQKALCVPFGMQAVALLGAFYIIRRNDVAGREAVEAFVDWLRSEVKGDAELAPAPVTARGGPRTSARKARSTS